MRAHRWKFELNDVTAYVRALRMLAWIGGRHFRACFTDKTASSKKSCQNLKKIPMTKCKYGLAKNNWVQSGPPCAHLVWRLQNENATQIDKFRKEALLIGARVTSWWEQYKLLMNDTSATFSHEFSLISSVRAHCTVCCFRQRRVDRWHSCGRDSSYFQTTDGSTSTKDTHLWPISSREWL